MADQRPLASEPTPITGAGLDGTIKKLSGGMGYSSINRIRRGNWGVGDADCRRRRANPFLEEFWVLHSISPASGTNLQMVRNNVVLPHPEASNNTTNSLPARSGATWSSTRFAP